MTVRPWGDPVVASTLREVLDDLGRRTAFDPSRLRAALADHLGSRAHPFRAQIDVLAVAAEEQVPQAMLSRVDDTTVRGLLLARDMQPEVVDWVLEVWQGALRLDAAAAETQPPVPVPPSGPPDPPPTRGPRSVPSLPPAPAPAPAPGTARPGDLPPTALPVNALPPTSLPPGPDGPATPGRSAGAGTGRRWLLAGAAGVVLAGLVAGGIALADRTGTSAVPTSSGLQTPLDPTPALLPTPATTPSPGGGGTPASTPTPARLAALKVLAHEGGGEHFAEETVQSLTDAARRGYAPETDVRWTSDGVAVLVHDVTPKPPMDCGKAYVIAKTRWATLRDRCRTSAGASDDKKRYPLPRFDEVTAAVAAVPGAQFFVEVKVTQTSAQTKAFYQTLAEHEMVDRTVVTSFFPAELAKMQAVAGRSGKQLRLMLFVRDHSVSAAEAKKAGLWAVAVRHTAVDAGYVKSLHGAGMQVVAWTPNERKEWAAVTKAGVDHVLTDEPGGYLAWRGTS